MKSILLDQVWYCLDLVSIQVDQQLIDTKKSLEPHRDSAAKRGEELCYEIRQLGLQCHLSQESPA